MSRANRLVRMMGCGTMTDDQLLAQFGAMGQRLDKVAERLEDIEKQLATIKGDVGEIRTILDIDRRIENLRTNYVKRRAQAFE